MRNRNLNFIDIATTAAGVSLSTLWSVGKLEFPYLLHVPVSVLVWGGMAYLMSHLKYGDNGNG